MDKNKLYTKNDNWLQIHECYRNIWHLNPNNKWPQSSFPCNIRHTTTTSVKVHDKSMVPGTRPQRKHAYIYLWSLLFLMAGCLTTAYSHVMHLKTILLDLIHFVIFDPHLATMTSILRWIGQWVRFSIRYSNFFSSQQVKRNSMCIYTLYETLINTVHKKLFTRRFCWIYGDDTFSVIQKYELTKLRTTIDYLLDSVYSLRIAGFVTHIQNKIIVGNVAVTCWWPTVWDTYMVCPGLWCCHTGLDNQHFSNSLSS